MVKNEVASTQERRRLCDRTAVFAYLCPIKPFKTVLIPAFSLQTLIYRMLGSELRRIPSFIGFLFLAACAESSFDKPTPTVAADTVAGPAGKDGEKGDQGIQGLAGPMGPQGLQGLQGDKGDKGDQGSNGLNGAAGSSCSVTSTSSGAIITCTNGTSAAISNGTSANIGSGTTGALSKWTSSTTLGNSVINEVSGNIGIGISTPTAKLEVNGGIRPMGANTGTTCSTKGVQAYDLTYGFPVYCNGSTWKAVFAGSFVIKTNSGGACSVANPITNACTCPGGTTEHQGGGWYNNNPWDHFSYYCY